ncbi:nuclear transcription factor Y subunit B-6-like [Nymphaea colorata]|nr:nuclear transcription factor Y subunit B-6-like [Nymphaea colorata]
MRRVLPGHAKISDDAKETVQDCVSEYISIVTREANRRCQLEQRKTITADDVLWAMRKLGLDDYVEPLSVYLHKFREAEQMPSPRPVIRKEAGPVSAGGFLRHPRHLQQLPHAMRGGGNGVGGACSGGGLFYKDFENTGGPGGGGMF